MAFIIVETAEEQSGRRPTAHTDRPIGTEGHRTGIVEEAPGTCRRTAPTRARRSAGGRARMRGNALPSWLLPVAAVVVVALLVWFFFLRGEVETADTATATGTAVTEAADGATDEAANAVQLPEGVSISGITDELSTVLGSTASTLEGIEDEASARASLPELKDATAKIGGLSDVIKRLPADARPPIRAAVASGLSRLEPIASDVLGKPVAGPVVEPVLAPMLETLRGLAAD